MRALLSGLALGESPRWHDGRLWFANWGTGDVVAVDLDGTTLFVLAAEWRGIEGLDLGERTGQVLVAEAPAPAAGYP